MEKGYVLKSTKNFKKSLLYFANLLNSVFKTDDVGRMKEKFKVNLIYFTLNKYLIVMKRLPN